MKRIKRLVRPVVQRVISPKGVQRLRFLLWCFSSYLPRLLTSRFRKRKPDVRTFGVTSGSSTVAKQLQSANLLGRTELCYIMSKCGSDKAGANNYTPLYWSLFKDRREEPLRVFELGLGSNNPHLASNMGVFGVPGASLRGWRRFFPQALVYGADIDRDILFEEPRIKTFYCDQLNQGVIRDMWSRPELQGGMDIIIEDGLHTFEANISFLGVSLDHLRPGGIYVIEDIGWDSFDEWWKMLGAVCTEKYPTYEFAFVVLADRGSNNVLVIRRSANDTASRDMIVTEGGARARK